MFTGHFCGAPVPLHVQRYGTNWCGEKIVIGNNDNLVAISTDDFITYWSQADQYHACCHINSCFRTPIYPP